MIDTKKVKVRMLELGLSQSDVCKDMKMAQPTYSQKISNARPMKLAEAEKLAGILNILDEEYTDYFFCKTIA